MTAASSFEPTLWRTCRALANRTRLTILHLMQRDPGLTVSEVADRLKLPLPVASQYLRALEARGLLSARRAGRRVAYQTASPDHSRETTAALVRALRRSLAQGACQTEMIFKAATAFTHPRRIEIYRALKQSSRTVAQLQTVTHIPAPALRRHLRKLKARGFVRAGISGYTVTLPNEAVGQELGRLALAEPPRA